MSANSLALLNSREFLQFIFRNFPNSAQGASLPDRAAREGRVLPDERPHRICLSDCPRIASLGGI
jgi:hypothetical protein